MGLNFSKRNFSLGSRKKLLFSIIALLIGYVTITIGFEVIRKHSHPCHHLSDTFIPYDLRAHVHECVCDGPRTNLHFNSLWTLILAKPEDRLKTKFLESRFGEGSTVESDYCLGKITDEWETSQVMIRFVTPLMDADVFYEENGKSGHTTSNNFIWLNRMYEVRGGQTTIKDRSPVHIKIIHPGYRVWEHDVPIDKGLIDITVNLEPIAKHSTNH